MIPIKLFQKYTIAIDSFNDVEVCCGFYGKYQYENTYNEIAENTYQCFNSMLFNTPVLYDPTSGLSKYLDPLNSLEIAQHESDLKLFIKLPISNNSSIVVLEGDYTAYTSPTLVKYSPTNKSLIQMNKPSEESSIEVDQTILNINSSSPEFDKNGN
jgi:hypothetical protein